MYHMPDRAYSYTAVSKIKHISELAFINQGDMLGGPSKYWNNGFG